MHSFSIHDFLIHFISDVFSIFSLKRGRFVYIADTDQWQLAILCLAWPESDCQIHQFSHILIVVHLLQPCRPVSRMLVQIGEEIMTSAAASSELDVSDQLGFAHGKGFILVMCAVKSLVRFTGFRNRHVGRFG